MTSICQDYAYKAGISSDTEFYWTFDTTADAFSGAVVTTNPETGWIGWGINPSNSMIGTDTIIGVVAADTILQYKLTDYANSGVKERSVQALADPSLTASNGETIMTFERSIKATDSDGFDIDTPGLYLIWAAGPTSTLSKHPNNRKFHFEFDFKLDTSPDGLTACPQTAPDSTGGGTATGSTATGSTATGGVGGTGTEGTTAGGGVAAGGGGGATVAPTTSTYITYESSQVGSTINYKAAYAHGISMAVAFGFLMPLAVMMPRYGRGRRSTANPIYGASGGTLNGAAGAASTNTGGAAATPMPTWLKLHVGIQLMGFALMMAALWCIVKFVTDDWGDQHFKTHHSKAGIGLLAVVLLQILGGALRPHAPRGGLKQKTVVRRVWEVVHRIFAVGILGVAIHQVLDGIGILDVVDKTKWSRIFVGSLIGVACIFVLLEIRRLFKRRGQAGGGPAPSAPVPEKQLEYYGRDARRPPAAPAAGGPVVVSGLV